MATGRTTKTSEENHQTWWLGWDRPLLPAAAKTLISGNQQGEQSDLSDLLCVLPTTRSALRLGSLFAEIASKQEVVLQPPSIITVGELPERLYETDRPIALEFEQTLSWASALQQANPDDLRNLITRLPDATSSTSASTTSPAKAGRASDAIATWIDLASTLRRLHSDLASREISFSDVFDQCETELESKRWQVLVQLHTQHVSCLDEAGLRDPSLARRQAIDSQEFRCNQQIILIGTSDFSDLIASLLNSFATISPKQTISMIAAPRGMAKNFDRWGRIKPDRWSDYQMKISDELLLPSGNSGEQAELAVTLSASLNSASNDQEAQKPNAPDREQSNCVIGVCDGSYVAPIEMQLRRRGLIPFRQQGWSIGETSVGILLSLVTDHLRHRSWRTLSALIRHRHVTELISKHLDSGSATWIKEVDQLINDHHPSSVAGHLPDVARKSFPLAIAAEDFVRQWLGCFDDIKKPIGSWCEQISQWLPGAEAQPTRTSNAIDAAKRLLDRLKKIDQSLDADVSGLTAIEMVGSRMGDARFILEQSDDAIAIVGWLELALDDCDSMIVVGLNHPFVPDAVSSDPFLPAGLQTSFRVIDNDRRYARDVYAMQLMTASRTDIRFIVGKTAADGTPTPPSRLLAAAAKEDVSRRVRMLLSDSQVATEVGSDGSSSDHVSSSIPPRPTQTKISVPTIGRSEEPVVKVMSVTAFKDYLTCPYRFYLRHALKIKPLADDGRELAANQFGDLIHGAVERFGESSDKDEPDEKKIEAALLEHLHAYADQYYGENVSMAVKIQIVQAERRLKTVAIRQAERIAAGWTIHATEASVDENSGAGIQIDGKHMGIRGRFDRIDHHQATGRWAILDYKTHGHKPEKKHLKKIDGQETWIDLQLPLYRLMIPHLGIDADPSDVDLGYFNVSEKDTDTQINLASFSESQLQSAEEVIHACVKGVFDQRFEPTDKVVEFDDYAMILQSGKTNVANNESSSVELAAGGSGA